MVSPNASLSARQTYLATGIKLAYALIRLRPIPEYPAAKMVAPKGQKVDGRKIAMEHEEMWTKTLVRAPLMFVDPADGRQKLARVIIGGGRKWHDLEIQFGGRSFFYNFKSLKDGHAASNVSGLSALAYLLMGEKAADDVTAGRMNEARFRVKLAEIISSGKRQTEPRDYFMIIADRRGKAHVTALGAMPAAALKTNPSNWLQSRFDFGPLIVRSQDTVFALFASKYMEYLESQTPGVEQLRQSIAGRRALERARA